MAVIMPRFCCCKKANLKIGGVVVGILSMIGSIYMLAMTSSALVMQNKLASMLESGMFGNITIEHWNDTRHLQYWSLTMDLISLIVAILLIFGTIKRIRAILYTYIVWTIIIVSTSFGGLFYMTFDGPRFALVMAIFQFCFVLGTAVYFILVVYSYSELLREEKIRLAGPLQVNREV